MKKKLIIIIVISLSILFISGITYSIFNSSVDMQSSNVNLASFIFNDQSLNELDIDINDLYPGSELEYSFFISNNKQNSISDTKIIYQLIIKTYHFIPLDIELYKVENNEEELVGVCDETYSRNSSNELVCNMPEEELTNSVSDQDNYKLKISFPSEYDSVQYSNLVDFIKINIRSYQKM